MLELWTPFLSCLSEIVLGSECGRPMFILAIRIVMANYVCMMLEHPLEWHIVFNICYHLCLLKSKSTYLKIFLQLRCSSRLSRQRILVGILVHDFSNCVLLNSRILTTPRCLQIIFLNPTYLYCHHHEVFVKRLS